MTSGKSFGDGGGLPRGTTASGKSSRDRGIIISGKSPVHRSGLSGSAMASGKSSGDRDEPSRGVTVSNESSEDRGELPRGAAASGRSPGDGIGLSGSAMASGKSSGDRGTVSRHPGAAGSTVVPYGGSVISAKALREVLAEGDVRQFPGHERWKTCSKFDSYLHLLQIGLALRDTAESCEYPPLLFYIGCSARDSLNARSPLAAGNPKMIPRLEVLRCLLAFRVRKRACKRPTTNFLADTRDLLKIRSYSNFY